jgi:CBS-domain-containing membrane protein
MRKGTTAFHIVACAAGGPAAIGLMLLLSEQVAFPLVMIPFATSIVLVMGMPDADPAQPRALIGGHLISTVVGLLVVSVTGPSPWAAAIAVGLAMAAMHVTRTFHPPAGIDPLIVVVQGVSWSFLIAPVAVGALLLAAFAWGWHNAVRREPWPSRWW